MQEAAQAVDLQGAGAAAAAALQGAIQAGPEEHILPEEPLLEPQLHAEYEAQQVSAGLAFLSCGRCMFRSDSI